MDKKITLRLSALLLTMMFCSAGPLFASKGPGEIVIDTIERGIKILEDPQLQGLDKFQERKDRLWAILTPVFNFEETSKRSLGHHWKDRTPEEQQEFVNVFTQVLRDIYLGKTDSYSGGTFKYVREIVKGTRGKVRTNFITDKQKNIVVDFSMNNTNGTWRVYDITVEGVSMVSNYRTQFNSIITKSSFQDLMERLNDKRAEFDLGNGQEDEPETPETVAQTEDTHENI